MSWLLTSPVHQQPSYWPGPVFYLWLGVSSDYAQPITGQVTEVTCPVIGWAQPELTLSKRQKTGPGIDCIWQVSPYLAMRKEFNCAISALRNYSKCNFIFPITNSACQVLTESVASFSEWYSVSQAGWGSWHLSNVLMYSLQTVPSTRGNKGESGKN